MTFHDILHTILVHRKPIFTISILGTIIFYILLTIFYPLTYQSSATILPPDSNKQGSLSGLLQSNDFSMLLEGSSGANSQLFAEVLKSRGAAEHVVTALDLKTYFDTEYTGKAVEKLRNILQVTVSKEGIIEVIVPVKSSILGRFDDNLDEIKELAAKIPNTYVEALDSINRAKLTSSAKRSRIYIGERLQQTKEQLDSVEYALMTFQQETGAVSLPEQVQSSIQAAAELKAELTETEIQLGMLSENLYEHSPVLQSLKEKRNQLQLQYNKLISQNEDILLSFKDTPELGMRLANLTRDVKILNEVYLLLQQQYYKELIQEKKDTPTVEILDAAIVPMRESSPRTVFSSVVAGATIFFLLVLLFVLKEKNIYNYVKKD